MRRSPLLAPVDLLVRGVLDVPAAIGGRATGTRLERMQRSARYHDGAFHNAVPSSVVPAGNPSVSVNLVSDGPLFVAVSA